MNVAFLGMGRMGRLMAAHVIDGNHELTIWNRTPGKASELTSRGAHEAGTVADAVKNADVVVMMLFGADSSHEVLDAVAGAVAAGTLIIDATTTGPDAARELGAKASRAGLRYVDAPVAGSLAPARDGTLTVFVGGTSSDVAAAQPFLELWGGRILHIGPVGSANALKVVVNMCLGLAMAGVGEALNLGDDLGLDKDVVLNALEAGPFGWSIKQKRQMLTSGDFTPTAFSVDLLAKDLAAALSATFTELPLTQAALARTRAASKSGFGDDDYSAIGGYREG